MGCKHSFILMIRGTWQRHSLEKLVASPIDSDKKSGIKRLMLQV